MATQISPAANKGLVERLRDFIGLKPQTVMSDTDVVTGMFRLGNLGTYAAQGWYYNRIVSTVWHNPTGFRCVNSIAAAFARAPLKCYAPGDEVRETTVASPLQKILDNPVPQGLSGVQPVSGKMASRKRARDLTLAGMSVTLKVRSDGLTQGPITQLRRLPPQRVTVLGNQHDELLGFIYQDRLGGRMPLLPQWVIYERFSHPDRDYQPFPPALAAGLGAESDNKAARFNLDLLENDGAVPAVVMLEGLTPDQFGEWVRTWEAHENPGKVRFMGFKGSPQTGGKSAEILKLGMTNEELQHSTIRDAAQEDMRRALGCPPVVAFDLSGETYANADHELKHWYSNTIWDYWDQSSDEMTAQLGFEFGVELGYAVSAIAELQESKDSMVDRLLKLQQNENLAINETNRRLGYPPVPWGDEPQSPLLAMKPQPVLPAGQEPPAPPAAVPPGDATPPSTASVRTLPRYRRGQGPVAALTVLPGRPPRETAAAGERLERQLRRFFAHQGRVVAKRLLSPGRDRSTAAIVRRGIFDLARWDDELAEDLHEYARGRELAERVNAQTRDELDALVREAVAEGADVPVIAAQVQTYFENRGAERAAELALEGAEEMAS